MGSKRGVAVDRYSAITWPEGAVGLVAGQPVVALDFDGVLNVTMGRDMVPPAGFVKRMVALDRANWPDHPYIRPLPPVRREIMHAIATSERHVDVIAGWLAAGAAVIWATTWERAIRGPARECGFPELPVLEMSAVPMAERPNLTALWKLAALTHTFAGHPLAWVDDFAGDWEGESQFGEPPAPMLAVAPDENVGLTDDQAADVTRFVSRYAVGPELPHGR